MRNFKRHIRRAIGLLLWCLFMLGAFGEKKPLPRDSSAIQARYFSQAKLDRYKADPDFRYQVIREPPRSVWDRFWEWFWRKIANMLSSRTGRATFKYTILVIAVAILILFLLQLRKMNAAGMFQTSRAGKVPFSISQEDIHAIDFEAEISRAVSDGNLRLAVRLLFLQALKKMSDLELIHWQIDKTNISYVNEVRDKKFYSEFQELTYQFEKNWYGNIPINLSEYERVSDAFHLLYGRISA